MNLKSKIIYVILPLVTVIAGVLYLILNTEYPVLKCNKSLNVCSLYTQSIDSSEMILVDFFKISDIRGYDIQRTRVGKSGSMYTPQLRLKNDDYVNLNFSTATHSRSEKIINEIIEGIAHNENYTKRGNYFQSFFGWY